MVGAERLGGSWKESSPAHSIQRTATTEMFTSLVASLLRTVASRREGKESQAVPREEPASQEEEEGM